MAEVRGSLPGSAIGPMQNAALPERGNSLIRALLGSRRRPRLSVLIFHRVLQGPDEMRPSEPTATVFEQRMRWVMAQFNVLPLAEAVSCLKAETLLSTHKPRRGEGKHLFKRAMEPMLPADVLYQPKTGFAVPLSRWLRGPLRERVRSAQLGPTLFGTGYFDRQYLQHLVASHETGAHDHSTPIWTLIMFEAFLRCAAESDGARSVPAVAA